MRGRRVSRAWHIVEGRDAQDGSITACDPVEERGTSINMGNSNTYCAGLSTNQRLYALKLKALGYPVSKLHKKVYETFPEEGKVYSVSQLRRWLSSDNPEVLDAIDAERKSARDKSYANKDSRILALVEVASDLFDELVTVDWKEAHKRGVDLLREFRLTMKDLREETDPFGIADQQIASVFENFITRVNEQSPTLIDETEWQSDNLTQKTPPN
jgi:hypothetical protein